MLTEIQPLEFVVSKAKEEFVRRFNTSPNLAACAPGRVNLIGEHTDYNDGFVLPMALPMVSVIVGKANNTNVCTVTTLASVGDQEPSLMSFEIPADRKKLKPGEPQWGNYVKGVIANFPEHVPGFNATICTNVPLGGGLSSSASLEVATFTFLEALTNTTHELKEKALLCQKAEHDFAGMPCGIMDQFISAMGQENHALLIDCKSLEATPVSINTEDVVFLITNSNVKHKLTGSEYPQRRAQCQNAATLLGEPSLRTVRLVELDALRKLQIEPPTVDRAKHVILEIERTLHAAKALQQNDFVNMGIWMNESHNSLRDLFEVSCPEIDSLVNIARSVEGVFGSRLTGGGFGGCTVTLVKKSAVNNVIEKIKKEYKGTATFYVCKPANGARILKI